MNRPERISRICFPDALGQGILLIRVDMSEGSVTMSLCFTVLGPGQRAVVRSPVGENERE